MAKKSVSKSTYFVWTAIFYCILFSGLIWQVTQISINFFQFDTSKDIKVIMPEESGWKKKVFNLCFDNEDILNYESYLKLLMKKAELSKNRTYLENYNRIGPKMYLNWIESKDKKETKKAFIRELTARERFSIAYNLSVITVGKSDLPNQITPGWYDPIEFILGEKFCYQINRSFQAFVNSKSIENVTTIYVSIGRKFNHVMTDYRKFLEIQEMDRNVSRIQITSYSYRISRLKWPYVDDCVNYPNIGYVDKLDAIISCSLYNQISDYQYTKLSLSHKKPVTESDYSIMNYTIQTKGDNSDCKKKFVNVECNQHSFFTQLHGKPSSQIIRPITLSIVFKKDVDPSFVIESKPRIDDIEFVTYILGALGTWLGFSFIILNPIPFILTIERIEREKSAGGQMVHLTNLAKMERESNWFKSRIMVLERGLRENNNERQQIKVSNQRMQQENIMFRNEVSELRKLIQDLIK